MEDKYQPIDPLNTEIKETAKVSWDLKLIAIVLSLIFVAVPLYEFITQLAPEEVQNFGCLIF